uniref:Major facilitator superfamily (MFS) profile domain-containing protein n=1 Tax=Ciona savignyi TaxID=51511 RepID=H2YF79_CIOSA
MEQFEENEEVIKAQVEPIHGKITRYLYLLGSTFMLIYGSYFAAVLHGITESCPWAGTSFYVTFLGQSKWEKARSSKKKIKKSQEAYVYKFFGMFFSLVYAGQLFGSSLTAAVLLGFQEDLHRPTNEHNVTFQSNIATTTIFSTRVYFEEVTTDSVKGEINRQLTSCASHDCQAEYIYDSGENDLNKFKPSKISTYVLLTLFLVISLTSICVQVIFLPRAPAKYDKLEDRDQTKSFLNKEVPTGRQSKRAQVCHNAKAELKHIFQHIISPLHLCFIPFSLYLGLMYAFIVTDYTRAFVSCTIGVEKLGVAMLIFGGCSVVGSLIGTAIIPRFGRKICIVVLTFWHFSSYLLSLIWQPNPQNTWIAYFIGAFYGIGNGFLANMHEGIAAVYFEDRLGIAFSVKNCITNLGIVAATAWSSRICVYVNLYLQIGCLLSSVLALALAEKLYNKQQRNKISATLEEEQAKDSYM